MVNIKVGIVEDEMLIARGIQSALRALGYEPTAPAASYTEAIGMMVTEQPDIVLLDIQLKGEKDGIDLARKIREDYNIPFIFLTANSDEATVARAKELYPPAYLVKPFSKQDLYTSIEVCLHNFSAQNGKAISVEKESYHIKEHVFIKQGQNFQKLRIEDILYIEGDNNYIKIFLPSGKFLIRSSIQSFMDMLGVKHVVRVHKSYAINTNHLDSISPEIVFIKNHQIPLGKAYRDDLLAFLNLS